MDKKETDVTRDEEPRTTCCRCGVRIPVGVDGTMYTVCKECFNKLIFTKPFVLYGEEEK